MMSSPFTLEQLRAQQERIRDKYTRMPEPTALPTDYAAKLAAIEAKEHRTEAKDIDSLMMRAARITARPQKATPQLLEYDVARRLTWAIMTATLSQRQKKIVIDEHNKITIQQLIKWTICDPACEIDLQKGIFITGPVGTGKTFLLDTMQALTLAAGLPSRSFKTARCVDIAELIRTQNTQDAKTASKVAARLENMNHGAWCFDDLGHEPLSVKVWGDDRLVMEPILARRYNAFTLGNCITHATSNLGKEDLRQFYGDRLADRFNEMFNFILLDGPSRRA